MNAKYIIVSKKNRTIKDCHSAADVATFMQGRRMTDWVIYQAQENLPEDKVSIESRLLQSEAIKS